LLTLLPAEPRFAAAGTFGREDGVGAEPAEGGHAQQRTAAMNAPDWR
jgi:hypothetical protein